MENEIFKKLFGFIAEENAEDLWMDELVDYFNSGGLILAVNPDNMWSLLHYASENLFYNLVLMLLKKGIPVDIEASNGSTPYLVALDAAIDAAIQNNQPKIDFSVVKLLIEFGANTSASSTDGISRESLLDNYGEQATIEYNNEFS